MFSSAFLNSSVSSGKSIVALMFSCTNFSLQALTSFAGLLFCLSQSEFYASKNCKKHLLTKNQVFDVCTMVDRTASCNLSSLFILQAFFRLGKCVIVLVGAATHSNLMVTKRRNDATTKQTKNTRVAL